MGGGTRRTAPDRRCRRARRTSSDARLAVTVTEASVTDLCTRLARLGVRRVVYTDVGRDGLSGGPNIEMTREVASIVSVIGSGGVSSVGAPERSWPTLARRARSSAPPCTKGTLQLKEALTAAC